MKTKTKMRAGSLIHNHNQTQQPQPRLSQTYVFEPWRATN
jgi:hypothetical protein